MANVRNRLSKDKWLEKSLEVLVSEGDKKLTIDHLVKAMGVTKGSFYWHFKNRADFITSLVFYWMEEYTLSMTSRIKAEFPDANKRLLALLKGLTETNHARYDFAVLYWGQYEPAAKAMVQEAMDLRGNAGLHVTIARWLLPGGDWIHDTGIEPDIEVELTIPEDEAEEIVDDQLRVAIEQL